MGASNFYNHENGIFVLEEMSTEQAYENYKERCLDLGEEIEPMNDVMDMLYDDITLDAELRCEMVWDDIEYNLPKGYSIIKKANENEAEVLNKQGKTIAVLILQSGYYEHAQIIVETDPEEIYGDYYPETQAELYEQYSPHHQKLLKAVSKATTPIMRIGGFSNGVSLYERV